MLAQFSPHISFRSHPFSVILCAIDSYWKPASNDIKIYGWKQEELDLWWVFTATECRPSFLRTMTNRRPKGKKKTSKPKETTQSTSSSVKLTIPARSVAAQADTQLSLASVQPVAAATPVSVEPPKALRLHTPPAGPESEDDIVITPPPKTSPLPSIGAKKVFDLDIPN